MLAGLAGVSGGESSLETEVKILESPSVLKPTYDYVKSNKSASGDDVSKWSYTDWVKESLKIELIPGTSILRWFTETRTNRVFQCLENHKHLSKLLR